MNKRIAIIIAHNGFRDEEYWAPKDIFEKSNIQVTTVSSHTTPATSKFGKTTPVDCLLEDIKASDFDAIVFVGGPGTHEYFKLEAAHTIANDFFQQKKLVTAICIAPVILAHAGLLQGKQATVFPSGKEVLEKAGATYTAALVQKDEQIITGSGPEAAEEFAQKIVEFI
ncbi:DJ-1/PfpI family protein [bacterium]|nr:DJ-1/PfpI family protein [bacterium]